MNDAAGDLGPANAGPRPRPRPSEVAAGTLTGLGLAGAIGGTALVVIVAGFRRAHPEPDPGGLAGYLVALVAITGGLAAVGGTFRGALGGTIGCLSLPLMFLIAVVLASQSLGLGWFWWLPFAIAILIPAGAIIGLSAELGVELHRRARSPRGMIAALGIVVPIVYVLAWMALYATQISRDRPLTDPPPPVEALPPNQPPPFPDRMPDEPLPASDSTGKPHAGT